MTDQEFELIASLRQDPAFLLLLDKIQARVDDLADELAYAETKHSETKLLAEWRAMRRILHELKTGPEEIGKALEEKRNEEKERLASINSVTNQKIRNVVNKLQQLNPSVEGEVREINIPEINPNLIPWNNLI